MTRRAFFAALIGVTATELDVTAKGNVGFNVSAHFKNAGEDPRLAYFSLGQHVCLSIDPEKAPALAEGAAALVDGEARLILTRA